MNRILLVDDSPHAQRIGERILADEGFEVVTVSNGDSALIRLEDADPDVLIVKAAMPGRSGYDICRYAKMSPRHRHVRTILTSGPTEALDDAEVERCGAEGTLKKPFEASALLATVRPLAEAAARERPHASASERPAAPHPKPQDAKLTAPIIAVIDPEQIRAAVTVALDAAMPAMTDEIAARVLAALTVRRSTVDRMETRPAAPPLAKAVEAAPLPPVQSEGARTVVRKASTPMGMPGRQSLRIRPGSILGLEVPENLPAAAPGDEPKEQS